MKQNRQNILLLQTFASLGNGIIGIFFPFLLGEAFDLSFSEILLWGGGFMGALAILEFPVNSVLNKVLSPKNMILLGLTFQSLFLTTLALPEIPGIFLLANIFFLLYFVLLWPSYHCVIVNSTDTTNRGDFIGNFQIILVSINIVAPILTGWLLENNLNHIIVWVSVFFFLISMYFGNKIQSNKQILSNGSDFKKFLRKIPISSKLGFMTEGLQHATMWLIWPIYLKIILKKFSLMGALISLAAVSEIFAAKFFGKKTDKKSAKKMIRTGILARITDLWLRIICWFFPNPIVIAGVLISGGILGPLFQIPVYGRTAELAEENKDHLLDFFVSREIILNIIRCLFLLFTGIIVSFFGVQTLWIFFLLSGIAVLGLWKY